MRSILHWAMALTLLFCAQTVLAQDLIILKSKEEIKAKVLEINESEMKYKRMKLCCLVQLLFSYKAGSKQT